MSFNRLSSTALLLATLAACGANVDGGGSGGAGGSGGSGGSGGAGGSGDVQCTGAVPTFPSFDKTCVSAADCVIKLHMINCCGSMAAIGVSVAAAGAFDAAEATCESQYPGCGCAASPTTTEDGKTSTDDTKIAVQCMAGACSTIFP